MVFRNPWDGFRAFDVNGWERGASVAGEGILRWGVSLERGERAAVVAQTPRRAHHLCYCSHALVTVGARQIVTPLSNLRRLSTPKRPSVVLERTFSHIKLHENIVEKLLTTSLTTFF